MNFVNSSKKKKKKERKKKVGYKVASNERRLIMLNYITKYVGIHKYADSILILPILILVF